MKGRILKATHKGQTFYIAQYKRWYSFWWKTLMMHHNSIEESELALVGDKSMSFYMQPTGKWPDPQFRDKLGINPILIKEFKS